MPTEILIKYWEFYCLLTHTHTHVSVTLYVCTNNICIFTWKNCCLCCFKHFAENSIFLCSLPKFRVLFSTFSHFLFFFFWTRIKLPTLCTIFLSVLGREGERERDRERVYVLFFVVSLAEFLALFCSYFQQFVLPPPPPLSVCESVWVGALLCFYLF